MERGMSPDTAFAYVCISGAWCFLAAFFVILAVAYPKSAEFLMKIVMGCAITLLVLGVAVGW